MRYRKLLKKWEKSHVVTTHFQLLLQNQWVAPFLRVNIRRRVALIQRGIRWCRKGLCLHLPQRMRNASPFPWRQGHEYTYSPGRRPRADAPVTAGHPRAPAGPAGGGRGGGWSGSLATGPGTDARYRHHGRGDAQAAWPRGDTPDCRLPPRHQGDWPVHPCRYALRRGYAPRW